MCRRPEIESSIRRRDRRRVIREQSLLPQDGIFGIDNSQKAAALDERLLAFDWTEVIVDYLEEGLTAYDAHRHRIRSKADGEALIDEVLELLRKTKAINTKPLITIIEGARPGLFTFLKVQEGGL
jgi:hypothetical protein